MSITVTIDSDSFYSLGEIYPYRALPEPSPSYRLSKMTVMSLSSPILCEPPANLANYTAATVYQCLMWEQGLGPEASGQSAVIGWDQINISPGTPGSFNMSTPSQAQIIAQENARREYWKPLTEVQSMDRPSSAVLNSICDAMNDNTTEHYDCKEQTALLKTIVPPTADEPQFYHRYGERISRLVNAKVKPYLVALTPQRTNESGGTTRGNEWRERHGWENKHWNGCQQDLKF